MSFLLKNKIENWKLKALPCEESAEVCNGEEWNALPGTDLPASVPGDWPLDLVRAGILPDPFFGDNYLKLLDYERNHVYYYSRFSFDGEPNERTFLRFEGIDTIADVYLNGQKIGHAENMFVEHEFPAIGLKKGENELCVHLLPVCLEARKEELGTAPTAFKYNGETLAVRKAAHSFGWDICPRIVGGGIWKPVYLVQRPEKRIKYVQLITNGVSAALADISVVADLDIGVDDVRRYELQVEGKCGSSRFSLREKLWFTYIKKGIRVCSPALWWPRGYGKPNLYDVTVQLLCDGERVDEEKFRYGIRTIKLVSDAVTTKEKPGRFDFFVNGKKLFLKGTNWVPCDAFHSRDEERMPAILDLVWDCGCNALRVWGGGVYESDFFYDWCDEHGIFVWQDFMMACAIYPQTERMKKLLEEEVEKVVRRLRNHPSLCLWAGDNECDVAYKDWFGGGKDPESNDLTRRLIPEILKKEDGTRPYLPSSPYLSPEAVERKLKTPEQHLWGPRKYFKGKFYRDNNATFASEIGYHGCPSAESVKKFIPEEYLWGYKNNKMWIYHASSPELKNSPYAYRIRLMARQIGCFFGEKPLSLESFSKMSQIVQAEAKKYFIESFRCRMGTKTGLIWWNVMDCWPQFSDAVTDYYFDKKLAYYYIRNSQRPLCLMMDKKGREVVLYAVSDHDVDKITEYTVSVGKKVVKKGTATAVAVSSTELGRLKVFGRKFFVIRWKTDEEEGVNHFLTGRPFFAYRWYKKQMERSGILKKYREENR